MRISAFPRSCDFQGSNSGHWVWCLYLLTPLASAVLHYFYMCLQSTFCFYKKIPEVGMDKDDFVLGSFGVQKSHHFGACEGFMMSDFINSSTCETNFMGRLRSQDCAFQRTKNTLCETSTTHFQAWYNFLWSRALLEVLSPHQALYSLNQQSAICISTQ